MSKQILKMLCSDTVISYFLLRPEFMFQASTNRIKDTALKMDKTVEAFSEKYF